MVGVLLIPPVIGLSRGISQQLESLFIGARPASQWFTWGIVSYVGLHLLLHKPRALFRFNHALLARLTTWLFGAQVTTVGAGGEKGQPSKAKSKGQPRHAQGSTLVVLSPYLVPLYVVLISGVAWLLARWLGLGFFNGLAVLLIGASLSFHLAMTADDLQQNPGQFPSETYLMALVIIGMASLLIVSLCLPMILPGFSILGVFMEATATARLIYTSVIRTLFF